MITTTNLSNKKLVGSGAVIDKRESLTPHPRTQIIKTCSLTVGGRARRGRPRGENVAGQHLGPEPDPAGLSQPNGGLLRAQDVDNRLHDDLVTLERNGS